MVQYSLEDCWCSSTVPVVLNEEQLTQRQQDLIHSSKLLFLQNNYCSATSTKMDKCSKSPKPEFSGQGGKGGRFAVRFNTLLVLVKKRGKVMKLRARSRRLIARLTRDGFAHVVAARHIGLRSGSPWGLVRWCSLQLHSTASPQPKSFYLRRKGKLNHQKQQGLHRSDSVVQFAGLQPARHKSVQNLQEKFELEMKAAEAGGSVSGVQNHQGLKKAAPQLTSSCDEIEDIFRTLEDTQ